MGEARRYFVGIALAAIVVQGAVLTAALIKTGTLDGYAFASVDGREYYAIARNLVEHGAFSQDERPPLRPDTWRTPGYPLFLVICMAVAGKSATALILVQQMLCVANVLLVFRIVRRWLGDRRSLLAAGLFALEPYHLYYSLWLMSTTLQTTFLLLSWWVWIGVVEKNEPAPNARRSALPTRVVALAVLCGGLVLIWPGAMLVPLAILVGLVALTWTPPRELSHNVRAIVPMFFMFCGVVIGGWMLRNQVVSNRLALSHQSGIVLAYFKAAEVALWREGRTAERYLDTSLDPQHADRPHRIWEAIDEQLRRNYPDVSPEQRESIRWVNLAQGNRTDLDAFRISNDLASIGWSMLWEAPLSTAACCLTRCAEILTFPLDLAISPPNGVGVDRARSGAIGVLYSALAAAVLVRLIRGRWSFAALYFPLACTVALLLAATPQTDPRFRVPMVPLLLFVALLPVGTTTDRAGRDAGRRA